MLLSTNPKIEEIIVEVLADGSHDSLVLLEKVQKRIRVTKQGFYRALRVLLKDEIVTKNKQLVLLNPLWSGRVEKFLERINVISTKKESDAILRLGEGDTMVFRFKNIVDLYLLWNHYFFIFCQKTEGYVVFFNTHNFWALVRSDIENEMYAWIMRNNKKAYSVIGYNTSLDRETSDYIKKDYKIEIAYEPEPSLPETVFPAVFGDYIMSTVLDANTVKSINNLYQKYSKWEPTVETELSDIINNMRRSKVVIERNKKKAEMLRKKLMKYFLFV
jgi:hypothetical protein